MPAECCKKFFEKMLTPEHADEPVFTLRAQDKLSRSVVHFWIMRLIDEGGSPEKVAAGVRHLREIEEWQKAHPDRVKIPGLTMERGDKVYAARVGLRGVEIEEATVEKVGPAEVTLADRTGLAFGCGKRFPRGKLNETPERALKVLQEKTEAELASVRAEEHEIKDNLSAIRNVQNGTTKPIRYRGDKEVPSW